jgi:hypothetical protein
VRCRKPKTTLDGGQKEKGKIKKPEVNASGEFAGFIASKSVAFTSSA